MSALDSPETRTRNLLHVLDVDDLDGARTTEDVFVGVSERQPRGRVFGGQVLAQSIIAAMRTVEDVRPIHSLHGYFLRPGDSEKPITYGIERLRDGRSFSARRAHAYQNGLPILSMIASFQTEDEGLDHQEEMPDVPGPETLPTTADLLAGLDHPMARKWSDDRPFDIRHLDGGVYLRPDPTRPASQAVWMRTHGPMPDDENLNRAALAYATDFTILESILRRHGLAWSTPGVSFASLDHAMWWHRPVRVDEWLLYVQNSPSASGARGLGIGRIFTRDGALVATVAQEGMVRVPAGTGD
ncbi:acyl-CoA thioesterase II [Tersicoccus sp. Bi-70]|uniref:acyl-CoA thioesterase n=1 Tax=Tersicoccus sp. Bi-70 TaxID=1897634 RepID=UPI0009756769|nr:acyl-CoA thioesterase II [Tersicoccus sp. Bi-70]OMH36794.1 acyl-CoA thioesterase II [Tersicoccus sp. Bi-70]